MRTRPDLGLITSIQAARGLAAIAVVLSHTAEILSTPGNFGHFIFNGYLRQGHAGVDFFFVLSGFIIFSAHEKDFDQPGRLPGYMARRALRVYPCLWMVLLITSSQSIWLHQIDVRFFVRNALLLPSHNPTGVTWTLRHEVIFYIIFSVSLLNKKFGTLALWIWFAACLFSNIVRSSTSWPWAPESLVFDLFLSSYNLDFALGIAAAYVYRRRASPFGVSFLLIGVCGFAISAICEHDGTVVLVGQGARFMFGLSAFLVVLGCATAEAKGQLRAGRILLFFGAASYSIYLVHLFGILFMANLISRCGLPDLVIALVVALFALACGSVLHLGWEAPVMRFAKRCRARNGPDNHVTAVDLVLADGTRSP